MRGWVRVVFVHWAVLLLDDCWLLLGLDWSFGCVVVSGCTVDCGLLVGASVDLLYWPIEPSPILSSSCCPSFRLVHCRCCCVCLCSTEYSISNFTSFKLHPWVALWEVLLVLFWAIYFDHVERVVVSVAFLQTTIECSLMTLSDWPKPFKIAKSYCCMYWVLPLAIMSLYGGWQTITKSGSLV